MNNDHLPSLPHSQKQQQLEEQHADIEYEIRVLMNKSDALKTDVDRAREEELLHQLIMVVEQRNKVVDNIDEDRIRYEEEDRQIEEILYNKGNFPIYHRGVEVIVLASRTSRRHLDTQTLINHPAGHPESFERNFIQFQPL